MEPEVWKVYYPEDGETAEDAHTITDDWVGEAEEAAQWGCEYDYAARDGWERAHDDPFPIIVIDPSGIEHHYSAMHEATVRHSVTYEVEPWEAG